MIKYIVIVIFFHLFVSNLTGQVHQWEEPFFMDFHIGGDSRSDMQIDNEGNVYLIALFEEEVSLLDTTLYSIKENGVFVAKFDINHNLNWAKVIVDAKSSTPMFTRVISKVLFGNRFR